MTIPLWKKKQAERAGKKEKAKNEKPPSFSSSIISFILLVVAIFAFKDSVLDNNSIPSGSMIPTLKIGDYVLVNKMRYSLRIPFLNREIWHIDDPKRGDVITFIPPNGGSRHYVKRVLGMPGDRIRLRLIRACLLAKFLGEQYREEHNWQKKGEALHRDYSCPEKGRAADEPVVTIMEYRQQDRGSWRRFRIVELAAETARKSLIDADETGALHPDQWPQHEFFTNRLPVLYREHVNEKSHLIVEKAEPYDSIHLCPEIQTTGCVVPEKHYFAMGDNRDNSEDSRRIGFISRDKILGKALLIYFSINWHDGICHDYWKLFRHEQSDWEEERGFLLKNFPPVEQARYCSEEDAYGDIDEGGRFSYILRYLYRTVKYRLPRMEVRWERVGNLLR